LSIDGSALDGRDLPEVDDGRMRVTLRVMGHDLNPASVSESLAVAPDFAVRRGETWSHHVNGRTISHVAKSGVWNIGLAAEPGWSLDRAVTRLFERIPAGASAFALLTDAEIDLTVGLFMGVDHQSTELQACTMSMLADRGIRLIVTVYAP
jgi:Domain of unknown function (DUF4279)